MLPQAPAILRSHVAKAMEQVVVQSFASCVALKKKGIPESLLPWNNVMDGSHVTAWLSTARQVLDTVVLIEAWVAFTNWT